jgi:hypothetical protein
MFCSEFHPFGMPPVIFWVLFSGHLPLDFLVRFLLVSFTLFLQNFMCSLLNSLSLSQPLSCMQVLEHLTWKHVWKHFVKFGAITVSCSLSLWHVRKSALVYIFEVGAFIFFPCTSKKFAFVLLYKHDNSYEFSFRLFGILLCYYCRYNKNCPITSLGPLLSLLLVEIRCFTARYPIHHANCLGFIQ